jgi:hypothetical protein
VFARMAKLSQPKPGTYSNTEGVGDCRYVGELGGAPSPKARMAVGPRRVEG